MKKIINKKANSNELWFNWLTRKLNSFEAFKEFASGKNPQDVADNFISINSEAIWQVFEKFDDEDKDILDQFQKLAECESYVFEKLKNELDKRNKVIFVDFKKNKK